MPATSHQPISAIAGWPAAKPGLAPRHGNGSGPSLLNSIAAAFRRKCQIFKREQRIWRQPAAGNGGPPAPNAEQQVYDSIWDDPLLWMMMMH
ncbi:MAG TPA: hypothetical protein VL985_05895 [Stellaceae bacterium]|nr:hypothetical protein [Stellaceae bacterium]